MSTGEQQRVRPRPALRSTRSGRSRSTRSRRRTRATPGRRWRWRRSPTRSGSATCASTRPTRSGRTATASCSRPGTPRCCSTRCSHLAGVQGGRPRLRGRSGAPSVTPRRHQALPPARLARPPGTPSTAGPRASRRRPGRSGRGSRPRSGWRSPRKWQAARFNRPGFELFDFDVYAIAGDGCLMEGVSHEAASLAGHLRARQPLLDLRQQPHHDRRRTPRITYEDDVAARFVGYGWNVLRVGDANDLDLLDRALRRASGPSRTPDADHRRQPHRLRLARTSRTRAAAHGEPLGEEEVRETKRVYGWPEDAEFLVPDGVREHFADGDRRARRASSRRAGRSCSSATRASSPALAAELDAMQRRELPDGWDAEIPSFEADAEGHRDPQGLERRSRTRSRRSVPVAARRLGRPRPTRPRSGSPSTAPGLRAGEPRRPQPPLRHPRARGGRDLQRALALEAAAALVRPT